MPRPRPDPRTRATARRACAAPRRLRAPEQQHREERSFVRVELELLVEDLVVLQRPPPDVGPDDPQQSPLLERPRGPLDGVLVVVDDGIPVARLVAGGPQRIGREGIRTRHRRLLLQQAAEDALVFGLEDRELGHADDLRSAGRCREGLLLGPPASGVPVLLRADLVLLQAQPPQLGRLAEAALEFSEPREAAPARRRGPTAEPRPPRSGSREITGPKKATPFGGS